MAEVGDGSHGKSTIPNRVQDRLPLQSVGRLSLKARGAGFGVLAVPLCPLQHDFPRRSFSVSSFVEN